MLLLLEGTDATGKTTLARDLCARLENPCYYHRGRPDGTHPLTLYELALDWYMPGRGHVVCDRWHLGGQVYGPLKRGMPDLTPAEHWHIEQYLLKAGALLVLTEAPNHGALRQRLERRGDDFISPDEALTCTAMFRRAWAGSALVRVTFRPGVDNPTDLLAIADTLERGVAHLACFPTYVGPLNPGVLLLGDRRGGQEGDPRRSRAAFPPYGDSSGRFLASALGYPAHVGIANANEEDVDALWTELGWPQVVALGRAATAGIPLSVPRALAHHPQYVRRFYHERADEYGAALLAGEGWWIS